MKTKLDKTNFLLDAMGEKINTYTDGPSLSEENRVRQERFVKVAVGWFAEAKHLSSKQAFAYLQKYQGIKFLQVNYEYEQTLPKAEILEDLETICRNSAS